MPLGVSVVTWASLMWPVVPRVCGDLAVDEVCYDGLWTGLGLVPPAAVAGWLLGSVLLRSR